MRPSELMRSLEILIPLGYPVLVKSGPGVGKTDIITDVVKKLGWELILTHPVVSEPIDFKGLPVVMGKNRDKADFLPIGDLRRMCEAKKKTVVFMDDIGQAPPATQAAAMQLLKARMIGEHKVSDKVVFIAATNGKEHGAGVTGILEPVKSRFVTILQLDANFHDWTDWAYKHDMPEDLIHFIQFRPNLLNDFQKTSDIVNCPSPRTVEHVGRIVNSDIPPDLLHETLAGAAGAGFAGEYIGFREIRANLPDPDLALKNPGQVKIPHRDDPATCFAFAGAIAERCTEKNIHNFKKLTDRFDDDYAVVAFRLAARRNPDLKETNAFIEWISENSDVFI